jgi:CRISPR/Cas system CMR-associated protein Cmr5 small subunit
MDIVLALCLFTAVTGSAMGKTNVPSVATVSTSGHPLGVLIEKDTAHATIVIPANAEKALTWAANDLQDVLHKMTGVYLPIAFDNQSDIRGNRILIGPTRFTDAVIPPEQLQGLGREGFIVRLKGRDLALCGQKDYGHIYAVTEIYHLLGARWYMPLEIGACIPKLDKVSFTTLDIRQVPSFSMRWMSPDEGHTKWFIRNRLNDIRDPELPKGFVVYPEIYHTQQDWIPPEKYRKTNPEFFAERQGKRSEAINAKLCNSNPKLAEEIAKNMKAALKEHPEIDIISLSPTDGSGYCTCDKCKALAEEGAEHDQTQSMAQFTLYNRVAGALEAEYPDQTLLVGAYHDYTALPLAPDFAAHKNLAVVLCHCTDYCMAHSVKDPTCDLNRRYAQIIRDWQKQVKEIYFYEYYQKTAWFGAPWPIVHTIKTDIPWYHSIGVAGLYTQQTDSDIWGNFLNHYITARLLWDHNADVDAILSEFYRKFYGKAEKPMRHYYETLEKKMASTSHHFPGQIMDSGMYVFTTTVMRSLQNDIKEARKLAQNSKVKQRIEKMAILTDYTQRYANYFKVLKIAESLKGSARDKMLLNALIKIQNLFTETFEPPKKWMNIVKTPRFGQSDRLRFPHGLMKEKIDDLRKQLKKSNMKLPPEVDLKR